MNNDEVDRAPDAENSHEGDDAVEVQPWKHYFSPKIITQIMHSKYFLFGLLGFLIYVCEFIMCVAACNFYSDVTRKSPCDLGDGVIKVDEDASSIMDYAIKLAGIYHIIAWIRSTIYLASVLLGENLIQVWYITGVVGLYGLGVFLYLLTVFFGPAGGCE